MTNSAKKFRRFPSPPPPSHHFLRESRQVRQFLGGTRNNTDKLRAHQKAVIKNLTAHSEKTIEKNYRTHFGPRHLPISANFFTKLSRTYFHKIVAQLPHLFSPHKPADFRGGK